MSTEQTERRIAAALAARAGGIHMDTSTLEDRFAELQERGTQQAGRRRRTAVGAAVVATAAAVLAAVTLAGGLLSEDDEALPADREKAVIVQPGLVGSGTPEPGRTYSVSDSAVPFTFAVPELGDVPGRWHYGTGEPFSVGLDVSPSTGHAGVTVSAQTQTYDPSRPWTEQAELVAAPTDAEGWREWVESTGQAQDVREEVVEIGGAPATRISFEIGDLPDAYDGCAPRHGCLATAPIGPGEVGSGFQAGPPEDSVVELTVFELGSRTVVATVTGAPDTRDDWLPVMRSVVGSLRFA